MEAPRTAAPSLTGFLQVGLAASLWGTWSLFLKPTGLEAWVTSPIMFLAMGIASLPLFRLDPVVPRWDRIAFLLLAANTLLDAVNVMTFFAAMDRTTVAVAVLTHYFAPVLVAVFAPLFDKQKVPGALFAAVLATAGLALVLRPWDPTQRGGDVLLGGLLGTISAFAYAGNVFVIQRIAARIGVARAMAWHSLAAGVILLPVAGAGLLQVEPIDLLFLISGAAVAGAFSGFIFVRGLNQIGSARAAVLTFLEPLVAVLVGWLVWDESLAPIALVGGVLIIAAGLLVAGGSGIIGAWGERTAPSSSSARSRR